MGHGAGDGKFRFQWNFPIFFSRHDPKVLFAAANVLFKTTDGGQSWTQLSQDLTRNDPAKLGSSGGPITQDNTSVEYYCTIFAATESATQPGVIWTGSDDGLIHVTQDEGKTWKNVTPPDMPEWAQINSIEAHPTEPGGLYVAATRYKLDDFKPYLFKTTDFGVTWQAINKGIDRKHFTRVVRADPDRPGLLYAGTESGLYISFDDGSSWEPFQCNVPVVPVTDIAVKEQDLIVATQGRSFWVLDDLTILHQWNPELTQQDGFLFESRKTFRMRGGGSSRPGRTSGQNVASGVPVRFYLGEKPPKGVVTRLEFWKQEELAMAFSSEPDKKQNERKLNVSPGFNQIRWDMRYSGAEVFDGLILWAGGTQGPMAVPGKYLVKLIQTRSTDSKDESLATNTILEIEQEIEIAQDPRSTSSVEDLQAQFDFLINVRDKLSEVHLAIRSIRDVRSQLKSFATRLKKLEGSEGLVKKAETFQNELTAIEEKLYQTKNQSAQDPLNFPIRLNNRLSSLVSVVSTGDFRPTKQAIEVRDELYAQIDILLEQKDKLIAEGIREFNEEVRESAVPAIFVEELSK